MIVGNSNQGQTPFMQKAHIDVGSLLMTSSKLDIDWLDILSNDVTFLVQTSQYHKILTGLEAHPGQLKVVYL